MYPKAAAPTLKSISPVPNRRGLITHINQPTLHRDPSSPDKLLKIQRKAQLRNAIIERFKAKHLKRETVSKNILPSLL